MTIEERAHKLIHQIFALPGAGSRDRQILAPLIAQAFRDLVEDCAKIADAHAYTEKTKAKEFKHKREPIPQATHTILAIAAERIAMDIRDLAEKDEVKTNERI